MNIFILLFSSMAFATSMSPTPFPVFLKQGFSSILEFEETPTQVVLGDQNVFQVEKLNRSLVIKPLMTYATTNMFVYFKAKETHLFILTASEDAEPTFYKKIESFVPKVTSVVAPAKQKPNKTRSAGIYLKKSSFDKKKDYLTVDFQVSAGSQSKIIPDWDLVRLKYKDKAIAPTKVWSERREVQKDTFIQARAIFTKPNIPASLDLVVLVVPQKGSNNALAVKLNRGSK